MKLSINWLKEYIDVPDDLQAFADDLTMAGLEVEEITNLFASDFAAAGGTGEKDDVVFNVKITPNRGDWLSVLGVAREGAAITGGKIKMPSIDTAEYIDEIPSVTIHAPDLCIRYSGTFIKGVKIAQSPGWLQDRLVAAGMRPINNVVDITNYIMLELGQPLHAFDLRLLDGHCINVRRANPDEKIISIDNQERVLDENMLVIADANKPVAIAGVMGGIGSEISDDTVDILLESANFDPVSVRRTSKKLGLTTESSYRFERGVDPDICEYAGRLAAEMIRKYASARIVGKSNDVYPNPVHPVEIKVDPVKANYMLGLDLNIQQMVDALEGYGIATSICGDVLISRVPTFRLDITQDVDIIEEIGRGYGYDKIPMSLPEIPQQGKDSLQGELRTKLRRILMSCGLQEVLSHSMVEHKLVEMTGREDSVAVRNPLSSELDSMRRMLIPNLLDVLIRNQSYTTQGISVFETGKIYFTDSKLGYDEKLSVSGVMCGSMWAGSWGMGKNVPEHDFYSCKGVVEAVLSELGISGCVFEKTTDTLLHPTRAAKITSAGRELGIFGEISPKIARDNDIRGRVYAFELDFQQLLESVDAVSKYSELPKYPAVQRHISIKVAETVAYEEIASVVQSAGGEYVRSVELIDIFRGEQIGPDVKSVTISVEFRADDRTLTDDDINKALESVRSSLTDRFTV